MRIQRLGAPSLASMLSEYSMTFQGLPFVVILPFFYRLLSPGFQYLSLACTWPGQILSLPKYLSAVRVVFDDEFVALPEKLRGDAIDGFVDAPPERLVTVTCGLSVGLGDAYLTCTKYSTTKVLGFL
ncbi:hypothetical protein BFW86_25465 [Pseudomonas fluorescens]|nr:hypothetical protein BFW86_25465 [Pseudomonas fluorescens]